MKSKRMVFRTGLAVLLAVGLLVSVAIAHSNDKKACCGTCSAAAKVTAVKASATACATTASAASSCASTAACASKTAQACPVQQFMTRLSRVELTETQIKKMMAIWQDTEKKMTALLTPTQLVKMNKPLPIQEQLAAQVMAQVSGNTESAAKACCGTCGGAAKTAAKACCGTCGGGSATSCSASGTKACSAGDSK
mgnify:CR=1 FL=1